MKRAGTYAATETAPENACYEALCELFGEDDVERHALVNGWDIDLRVNSLNTCIQVDGTYWHGLDRHVATITEFKHPRDRVIYSTFLRDKRQVEWFKSNGLKLVRVTDTQIVRWMKVGTLKDKLSSRLYSEREESMVQLFTQRG